MNNLLVVGMSLLLTACAAPKTEPPLGPHGTVLYAVDCVGPVDNCNMEAIKICPNGFNIVDAVENPTISLSSGFPLLATKYSLKVECK